MKPQSDASYRVIWVLENGRKRYSSNPGGPEIWSDDEIEALRNDLSQRAYTPNYTFFVPDLRLVKQQRVFKPGTKFILITSFETQSVNDPVIDEYLW